MKADTPFTPTLTRPQFKLLEQLTGGAAITGERLNPATCYKYRVGGGVGRVR